MLNRFIISIILTISGFQLFGQLNIKKFSEKITFSNPDTNNWAIVTDELSEDKRNGVLMFKHKPFTVSGGEQVNPIIAIVYEKVEENIDVAEYSRNRLGEKFYKITHELLGGYPDYSSDKHSLVLKGNYLRDNVKHKVILAYILFDKIGIEIIGDSTDDIYPKVETDFKKFVKSVIIDDGKK